MVNYMDWGQQLVKQTTVVDPNIRMTDLTGPADYSPDFQRYGPGHDTRKSFMKARRNWSPSEMEVTMKAWRKGLKAARREGGMLQGNGEPGMKATIKHLGGMSGKALTNVVPVAAIAGLVRDDAPLLTWAEIKGGAPGKLAQRLQFKPADDLFEALNPLLGGTWFKVHMENGICETTRTHAIRDLYYPGDRIFDLDSHGRLVLVCTIPQPPR